MSERCSQFVYSKTMWRPTQCTRKAVRDGYCWQHHPDAVEERRKASREEAERKWQNSPWKKLERALRENEKLKRKIRKLEKQLEKK